MARLPLRASIPRRARSAVLAAVAGMSAVSCGPTGPPRPTLTIGLLPTQTGEFAVSGQATINAARLAVDHANQAALVVGGFPLTTGLVIVEAPPQPEAALRAARQLINRDRVGAIVGPSLSAIAIPVADAAHGSGVPMITPGASHPDVTLGRPSVFRVVAVDRIQGAAMARFAREELNAERAAVLFDRAASYNRDMSEVFREEFERHGGRITAFASYVTGESDFSGQLEAIRDAGADVVYLPNYPADLRIQLRQLRELDLTAVALGSGSWSLASFGEDPELFEGGYHSSNWNHDVDGVRSQEFVRTYRARFGELPITLAALTYDAIGILIGAIQRAQGAEPEALLAALAATRDYDGVTGRLSFDAEGDPVKATAIVQILGEEARFRRWISPETGPHPP